MTLGILQQKWPTRPDERQEKRLLLLKEACEMLRAVMHESEGSLMPGEHQEHIFQSQRMTRAANLLEMVEMLATKAALE